MNGPYITCQAHHRRVSASILGVVLRTADPDEKNCHGKFLWQWFPNSKVHRHANRQRFQIFTPGLVSHVRERAKEKGPGLHHPRPSGSTTASWIGSHGCINMKKHGINMFSGNNLEPFEITRNFWNWLDFHVVVFFDDPSYTKKSKTYLNPKNPSGAWYRGSGAAWSGSTQSTKMRFSRFHAQKTVKTQ